MRSTIFDLSSRVSALGYSPFRRKNRCNPPMERRSVKTCEACTTASLVRQPRKRERCEERQIQAKIGADRASRLPKPATFLASSAVHHLTVLRRLRSAACRLFPH